MLNKQVSNKHPIDEESLKKHLIEKEQADEELWEKIQEKAKGKEKDREAAIMLIFSNYRKVPTEADDLLRAFASHEQPVNVRIRLAIQISEKKTKIPVALYFDLIRRLNQDPKAEVRKIIYPDIEEWLKPLIEALTLALRRLRKYGFIRKVLYYDMNLQKPKLLYVSSQDNAHNTRQSICIWLRNSVLLDNKIPCYYDVFLDWAGDKIDHDLTFTGGS